MDWISRLGRASPPSPEASPDPASGPREGSVPGIAQLLDGVREDGSHSVLDLGPAGSSSFRVYSRFARRMRFADLLAAATTPRWDEALRSLPSQPERPYDLVFAWNILDWIPPRERSRLVERIAEVSAPNARLHALVATERATTHPLRFSLLEVDRIRYEPTGPPQPPRDRIVPADVEELLGPFQVVRAFTLKSGLCEYVATREGTGPGGVSG